MTKQRDDIEGSQVEQEDQQQNDEQEHVEVEQEGDKVTVKSTGESRRERREREHREQRAREIAEAVNPLKGMLEQSQQQLRDLMARMQAPPQVQQQRQEPVDDVDEQYMEIAEKQEALLAKIRQGGHSPEQLATFKRQYYKLDRDRSALAAKPVASEAISKFRPQQGPSAYEQQLASEHPEAWYDERARNYAATLSQVKQAELQASGRTVTPADVRRIHKEALERSAEVFGLKRPATPAPSDAQRARFNGTSATAKSQGGPVSRQLNEQEQQMARAMSPGLSDKEAFARWAKLASEAGI